MTCDHGDPGLPVPWCYSLLPSPGNLPGSEYKSRSRIPGCSAPAGLPASCLICRGGGGGLEASSLIRSPSPHGKRGLAGTGSLQLGSLVCCKQGLRLKAGLHFKPPTLLLPLLREPGCSGDLGTKLSNTTCPHPSHSKSPGLPWGTGPAPTCLCLRRSHFSRIARPFS